MNIQSLNRAIPNVHEKYAEKLQALQKSIEADHHKGMSTRERGILKSLTFGMTGSLVGLSGIVMLTATTPVLAATLAVGAVSLGKAIYHQRIEKSLHDQMAQLTEDYRSGALEEQLSKVSLWDRIKSNISALTKAMAPPAASIEPAQVATSLAENIDNRLQDIYTKATGRPADYESTFDWISSNPFEKLTPSIAADLLGVASSRGLLDAEQTYQVFNGLYDTLSANQHAVMREELKDNAPRAEVRREAAAGLGM